MELGLLMHVNLQDLYLELREASKNDVGNSTRDLFSQKMNRNQLENLNQC